MSQSCIEVAIGLLFYQSQVLVGWRNSTQHQGNKYEFPGGKVEVGERAIDACRREVFEEVGVDLEQWHVFDLIQHQYDDVTVKLHIFHAQLSTSQLDQIRAAWSWYTRPALTKLNFPAANQQMIQRLLWPKLIKISTELTVLDQLSDDRLLYVRCDVAQFDSLVPQLNQLSAAQLSRLILNIDLWTRLERSQQANIGAVHFKQWQLLQLGEQDLPRHIRCVAACHDAQAIAQANRLGLEAIMLSPVLATPTHPEQSGLGWENFAQLVAQTQLPVFALGGVNPVELDTAQQHGAYGLAGIRNF